MGGSLRAGSWPAESSFSSSNGSRSSNVANVVLPAYGREAAGLAAIYVVGLRRKLSATDCIDRVHQPLLRLAEHSIAIAGEQRHDTPWPLERQVHRFAQHPRTAAMVAEPL